MSWTIGKAHEFDFGHRVWTQEPDPGLSCGHQSVCRHLHGHRGTVIINLTSDILDKTGMVTDFVNLNWFKKFVDNEIDHKMVLDIKDPALPHLFPLLFDIEQLASSNIDSPYNIKNLGPNEFYTVNTELYEHEEQSVVEIYDGLVLVNFVPTSENLSQWFFRIVQDKMSEIGITVHSVEFKETPKSHSTYSLK